MKKNMQKAKSPESRERNRAKRQARKATMAKKRAFRAIGLDLTIKRNIPLHKREVLNLIGE